MGRVFGLVLVIMISHLARAESSDAGDSSKSQVKLEDVKENNVNKVDNSEEIDEMITNKNLRAFSGSVSRWSMASMWNYNGATINSPFSEDRPNIAEQSATTAKADLDGNVSAKYNINVSSSVMAGVGLRWIAPLAKNGPSNYDGTRFDVENPYLQYQFIYNWGVQSVLQAQIMQWTQADSTSVGYDKQYNIDQENMWEIGKTGLSIGASVWAEYTSFNKSGAYQTPASPNFIADMRSVQADRQFGFTPEVEYELTEKINLRTMVSLWVLEHYRNMAGNSYFHDKVYQSVGIGYSVTRDVFLYPNVQFLPDDIASNVTNVGLQATINVF